MKRDRSESVILESSDGTQFTLSTDNARKSKTISNLIDDIGMDKPIPINVIKSDILSIIVGKLDCGLIILSVYSNSTIIQILLAANYLDIGFIFGHTAQYIREKFQKFTGKYENSFNDHETTLILQEKTLLNDIRVCYIRNHPEKEEYTLLDVPKDVLEYILPQICFNNRHYTNINTLINFRLKHRYFWHVTTLHIVKQARKMYDLIRFSDEEVFDFVMLFYSYEEDYPKISHFGLTRKDTQSTDLFHLIIEGYKKFGSIEKLVANIEKKRAASLKAKQTRKTHQENIEKYEAPNKLTVEFYMDSLGYKYEFEDRLSFLIEDPKNDVYVRGLIYAIESRISNILMAYDLNSLPIWLKDEKILHILSSDRFIFNRYKHNNQLLVPMAFTCETFEHFEVLLDSYKLSMLEEMEQVFQIENELEKEGFQFSRQEIMDHLCDKNAMINIVINASDLVFIYRHCSTKERFVSILKKEYIYV